MKKAFRDRVIEAIAFTIHTLFDALLFYDIAVTDKGILTASVGMPEGPFGRFANSQ